MLGAIGEVLGNVFGSRKAVDNLLDKDKGLLVKAGSWVGNLNYTEEDKAENDQLTRKWGLSQLEALAPFKIMQRIMVSVIMFQWAVLFNAIVACTIWGTDKQVEGLFNFACTQYAWYPVGAAVTLYLAGGVWKGKENN